MRRNTIPHNRAAFAALLCVVLALSACATTTGSEPATQAGSTDEQFDAENPVKVAFIYAGAAADGGWYQAHEAGRKEVEQEYGASVETSIKENVPEGPQSTQVIDSLVQAGNDLIVAASFGYHEYLAEAAKKYPATKFLQLQSTETAPNLSQYYVNIAESFYVAGMAVGAASKTGRIGMVAPFPFPNILSPINAFALGAKATNPAASVNTIFINTFFDPAKERQAAQSLLTNGADALAAVLNDATVGQVAEQAKVPWMTAQLTNGASYGPNTYLTEARYQWGPIYKEAVGSVLTGDWASQTYWGTWQSGATAIGDWGPAYEKLVDPGARARIEAAVARLAQGKLNPFTGPIEDQSGKVVVPAGESLEPEAITEIDWLAANAQGNLG